LTHQPLPPFASFSGPRNAKLLIIGEAWGQHEAELRKPFVGESGKELFQMLGEAFPLVAPQLHAEIVASFRYGLAWVKRREEWLTAASIAFTNTLNLRPPGNKIPELCASKKEVGGKDYLLPPIEGTGKYLRPEFLPELTRLQQEIEEVNPNLLLLAGAKASWACLRQTNISSIRGAIAQNQDGRKCLATYHPAGVMRQWSWRPIVVNDLMKAAREMEFPEVKRPTREILVSPSIEEVEDYVEKILALRPPLLACDTETTKGQIKCIGFAHSRSEGLVIPLIDEAKPGQSYWEEAYLEERALAAAARLLESDIPKVFQNGLYDFQYLMPLGFRLTACLEDTMLLHHSILPEMKKGLGFLGSNYTDEVSWKLMRTAKPDTEKRDE